MKQGIGETFGYREALVRFRFAVGIVVLAASILIIKLYYLQIYRGEEFEEKSQSNFVQFRPIPAPRGIIFDRSGEILADSRPAFNIYVTPAFCKHLDETLKKLDSYLGLTLEEYESARKRLKSARGLVRFQPQLVKSDVERESLARLYYFFNELEGVDVLPKPARRYRFDTLGAHMLGYVNEIDQKELSRKKEAGEPYRLGDVVGRGGVEEAYEGWLHGVVGEEKVVVDARGKPITGDLAKELIESPIAEPARAGQNVYLTIDRDLQAAAEKAFDKNEALTGALVALDPNTGAVLAHVSRPEFSTNELAAGITHQLWNRLETDPLKPLLDRVIQATYPPGSTFKTVTALAGLASGKITPEETIYCPGVFNFGSVKFRCWKDSGHGPISLVRAIAESCDVYFYNVGHRVGTPFLMEIGAMLGLGQPLGIALPNEKIGVLPTIEWHSAHTPGGFTEGQTINAAIGQGAVTLTPLQLAVVYSVVANGGKLYRPHWVTKITDSTGKLIKEFPPELIRELNIPKEDFAKVREGLTAVMNTPGGTAYWKAKTIIPNLVGAGKTGTAQIARMGDVRKKSEDLPWHLRDHALFATFVPAEGAEIVVIVVNEHGGHGGSTAAPIALETVKSYFEMKGIN